MALMPSCAKQATRYFLAIALALAFVLSTCFTAWRPPTPRQLASARPLMSLPQPVATGISAGMPPRRLADGPSSSSSAASVSSDTRVAHGEGEISQSEWETKYDFVVKLVNQRTRGFCTGTIWGNRVLTAAHCDSSGTGDAYTVKTASGQTLFSRKVDIHPRYNENGHGEFDFMLVTVNAAFDNKASVLLKSTGNDLDTWFMYSGMGRRSADEEGSWKPSRPITTNYWSTSACPASITDLTPHFDCIGSGADTPQSNCGGDSGGPLLYWVSPDDVIVGGVLNKIAGYVEPLCGHPGTFSLMSTTHLAHDWLEDIAPGHFRWTAPRASYVQKGDGICGIDGDNAHEFCFCDQSEDVQNCEAYCDFDPNCVGYAPLSVVPGCSYATTSECNAGCKKHKIGNVGPITAGPWGNNYAGCFQKPSSFYTCTDDWYCTDRLGDSISGTEAEIRDMCIRSPLCTGYDYKSESGAGALCVQSVYPGPMTVAASGFHMCSYTDRFYTCYTDKKYYCDDQLDAEKIQKDEAEVRALCTLDVSCTGYDYTKTYARGYGTLCKAPHGSYPGASSDYMGGRHICEKSADWTFPTAAPTPAPTQLPTPNPTPNPTTCDQAGCDGRCASTHKCCPDSGRCVPKNGGECSSPPATCSGACFTGYVCCPACGLKCLALTESCAASPTKAPTSAPSAATSSPTKVPTSPSTEVPTSAPTKVPTASPTEVPTSAPTQVPTMALTTLPTCPALNMDLENPGRCGSEFGRCNAALGKNWALYCNTASRWCGKKQAHADATDGDFYDFKPKQSCVMGMLPNCPALNTDSANPGRCGPKLGRCNLALGKKWALYCNAASGWCGKGQAHANATDGDLYDFKPKQSCVMDMLPHCPALNTDSANPGRCGPKFGRCNLALGKKWALYCNAESGWCGKGQAHAGATEGDLYDFTPKKSCSSQ